MENYTYHAYNTLLNLDLIRSSYSISTHIIRSRRFRKSVNYHVIIIIDINLYKPNSN